MSKASDKIMKRIRALLAMAKDTSSPNEAAIAAARARKLMDEYQVSELDVGEVSSNDFGTSDYQTTYQRINVPISYLGIAVAQLNDCVVKWAREVNGVLILSYSGFLNDTVTATEITRYLVEEMNAQAERAVPKGTPRLQKMRHAYKLGFGGGVQDHVRQIMRDREKIKMASGTSLMVIKDQLVTQQFGVQKHGKTSHWTTKQQSEGQDMYQRGHAAGRNMGLDRQVNETRKLS